MQVFIGYWTPTEKWSALSAAARTAYLSKVSAATRLKLGGEAESVAWGKNEDPRSQNQWKFFCVWKFPRVEMCEQYLAILDSQGWNEYFQTESMYAAPKTPFDVLTQHVTL